MSILDIVTIVAITICALSPFLWVLMDRYKWPDWLHRIIDHRHDK